ncbi:MAG: LemA family protein [Spirochaetaceae bacterium]|nr:MAG: LemA family protein [Spirochaetaceae bacterium]
MKSFKKALMFGLVVVAVVALSSCGYNRIQQLEETVFRAWGDLDAQLQRRSDLIPNLVATVKGFAAQERETLEAVVNARSRATSVQLTPEMLSDPQAVAQFQEAQGSLSSALSRLLVVVEAYPDLKSNQNFRDLQVQLEGTENRISVARQRYNEAVERFNFSIRRFPYSLTNNLLLHLERKAYFEAEAGAREAPKVEF